MTQTPTLFDPTLGKWTGENTTIELFALHIGGISRDLFGHILFCFYYSYADAPKQHWFCWVMCSLGLSGHCGSICQQHGTSINKPACLVHFWFRYVGCIWREIYPWRQRQWVAYRRTKIQKDFLTPKNKVCDRRHTGIEVDTKNHESFLN